MISPRDSKPNPWKTFWQTVTRFQVEKISLWMGLRNALGIALPLAAGAAAGVVPSGVAMSTGALNVAFSDNFDPYSRRGRRMFAASVIVALAVFAGAVNGNRPASAVAVETLWAFAAGLLVALNTTAADIGVMSLVVLVVFAAQPMSPERALSAGLLAFAGGILQTLLSIALWPFRRYDPERRALADLYLELARSCALPVVATDAPPASLQSVQAQTTLASLGQDHSIEAERYLSLLSQAERMRLSLVMLGRLRIRIQRESEGGVLAGILDRCLINTARVLSSVGNMLLARERADPEASWLREIQELAEQLREPGADPASPLAAMAQDARIQMDALAGQLNSALDLASHAMPEGAAAFERREARQPARLRIAAPLATLRANLTLRSAACRHAIRVAACVLLGDSLARGIHLPRSYWVPMTIAIVLKPDFTATFSRGVLRLAGTLAGLVFATALFHALSPGLGAQVALIGLLAFVLRCYGPANYGILVAAVTALVVLILAVIGVAPIGVMVARGVNTVVGGLIALLAYWIWPTWERTQAPESLAQMLDAYRAYFRAIRENYLHTGVADVNELERTRAAGRLARSNLEASVDRWSGEPGNTTTTKTLLAAILANSRRLAHAMMALEAGLAQSDPNPPRPAFRTLANHIELTLYSLAAALRGSPLLRSDLPDLREDHHALIGSGEAATQRYALVNVETDRIANSLNTLSGEVLRWINEP